MQFNLDSFVEVQKYAPSDSRLETGTVRINNNSVRISPDVARRLIEKGEKQVALAFQFSMEHNAIRVTKAKSIAEGFVFNLLPQGCVGISNMPSAFKAIRIPRGVYKLAEGYEDIFVLASESVEEAVQSIRARYLIEDSNVSEGDIVSWMHRFRGKSTQFIATGEVLHTFEKGGEVWASVKPISKNFQDEYPDREFTNVNTNNLIVREKKNAK